MPAATGSINFSRLKQKMGRSPSVYCSTCSKLLKYNRIFDFAPASGREIGGQFDGSVAHPDQAADGRAGGLEDAPDFPVAPLAQRHAIPAVGALGRAVGNDALKGSRAVFELNAFRQSLLVPQSA